LTLIHIVCGARPNFIKAAPLYKALTEQSFSRTKVATKLIHTGQHYDDHLSGYFFRDLDLPTPHFTLNIGSGSHSYQTAHTILAYDKVLNKEKPDLVIVIGDVNATLACALTAKKQGIKVAHLEAGLRNKDLFMPEEINRVMVDAIADLHWTPSKEASHNLINEGISTHKIKFVGNILIDSYSQIKDKIEQSQTWKTYSLLPQQYILCTLHRPLNVDSRDTLAGILHVLGQLPLPVVFPVHPRTRKTLRTIEYIPNTLKIIDPLGYIDFMSLLSNACYVISDSGGIQEETTYLKIPCFTLRKDTERPITVTTGSNTLVNLNTLLEQVRNPKTGSIPPLWDGKTCLRILETLKIALFL
jgi:UDP-N-acetylglucosamine 2-epimerase (non-hydrolysing)